MLHLSAIVAHAVCGAVALGAGVVAIERASRAVRAVRVLVIALVGMWLTLVLAVGLDWPALDTATRVLFGALTVLGVVVVGRGVEALRRRPAAGGVPDARFRDPVGFTVVALTTAFLVVLVLDLGFPAWAVAVTGVVVVAVGHRSVRARLAVLDRRGAGEGHEPLRVEADR